VGCPDYVSIDRDVGLKEPDFITHVGEETADFGRSVDHNTGLILLEERRSLSVISQVSILALGKDESILCH
jgi:hypothetical protein